MSFFKVKFLLIVFIILACKVDILLSNITVSTNGFGNFQTISEAIAHAPSHSLTKFTIFIKAGTYKEYIIIGSEKTNLVLAGEDKSKTIITGDRSAAMNIKTYHTATVAIFGAGCIVHDITIQNTAGPENHQAVALLSQANHLVFYRCRFIGYQDTLYALNGYQFFRECDIYGTVDFIFGNAVVIFQTCFIYVQRPLDGQKNTIFAQGRDIENYISGSILSNSTILATTALLNQKPMAKTFLGRPWRNYSRTIIMQCFLGDFIDKSGWIKWENKDITPVYYAEYLNNGPGSNTEGRVSWSKIIDKSEANAFTVRNFLQGDGWIPSDVPHFLDFA